MVLFGEVDEGASYGGILRYEVSVVVCESKEGVDFFQFSWGRPSRNPIEFDRVHGDFIGSDDHSEIFDFGNCKLALRQSQMKA